MRPRLPTLDYSEDALPLPLTRAARRPDTNALATSTHSAGARAMLADAEQKGAGSRTAYVTSALLVLGASAAAVGAFVRWIAPIVAAHGGP